RAGQQPSLQQDLKAVADAKHRAASFGKFRYGLHYRRKTRDGAGAQIVAVRKAAGKDQRVKARQIFALVPDEFDRLVQHIRYGIKRIVIAIGSGKDYDSKFHARVAPAMAFGNISLSQGVWLTGVLMAQALLRARFCNFRSSAHRREWG